MEGFSDTHTRTTTTMGAAPGIEPGTSRTRTENHATRPSSHANMAGALWLLEEREKDCWHVDRRLVWLLTENAPCGMHIAIVIPTARIQNAHMEARGVIQLTPAEHSLAATCAAELVWRFYFRTIWRLSFLLRAEAQQLFHICLPRDSLHETVMSFQTTHRLMFVIPLWCVTTNWVQCCLSILIVSNCFT